MDKPEPWINITTMRYIKLNKEEQAGSDQHNWSFEKRP
jgi:hypothetical protein